MKLDVLGELRLDNIKGSLRKLGVPATDANAHAMIKCTLICIRIIVLFSSQAYHMVLLMHGMDNGAWQRLLRLPDTAADNEQCASRLLLCSCMVG